ncbi:MAG: tRNA (N(6)-L-threonylcarbamoyladenosine(37)-C(2))-methylthiotransferase MtaB [Clostridia bacterium]|nr:tRNA (N(6)-L-threonylcarbamoyladenosine(37)-C(2))-methylthiotransferase MtaB [Clostridia bacterium]
MKAAFITLGCKVNQYESEAVAQKLQAIGYEIVDSKTDADVYVINSCTVTAESDRKTRQTVRRIKKQHPNSVVVLTGCMPQAFPDDAINLQEADIVTGNKLNSKIPDLLRQYSGERISLLEPHKTGEPFCCDTVSSFRERTRATLKIEDGCNRFCSYCIIPYARGRVRSKPIDIITQEAQTLATAGYKEIVLVGINLSAYCDNSGAKLADAVIAAANPEGIARVRLGSLEPDHITDEVISALSKEPKFCPQFHISLQSGCDSTLKRMNRKYTCDEYRTLCSKLRSVFPDATITTDVMVGFAGETDEDFEASLRFVEEIGFEKVHVFPYSRREGTPAARMPNQVEKAEKERRACVMAAKAEEIRKAFLEAQVGKTLEILPEEFAKDGFIHGYTANYTPVKIKADIPCDELIKVKITQVDDDCCVATL